MTDQANMAQPAFRDGVSQADYEALAAFRLELRRFLNFSETAARGLGMTPQQHQTMLAIRAAPGRTLTIGQLAEQLFVQPHSTSELAERMVAMGWLIKLQNQEDRRSFTLGLTPVSEDILERMSATHREEVIRIRPTLEALLARLD